MPRYFSGIRDWVKFSGIFRDKFLETNHRHFSFLSYYTASRRHCHVTDLRRQIDPPADAEGRKSDLPSNVGDCEAHQHRARAVTNLSLPLRHSTFNCRTLKARWRRGMLVQLASSTKMDLVMIQELSIVCNPGIQREDLGGHSFSPKPMQEDEEALECCLDRDYSTVSTSASYCFSLSRRLLRVDLRLRNRGVHLFCVYAPTATHPEDARDLFEFLSGHLDALPQQDYYPCARRSQCCDAQIRFGSFRHTSRKRQH